LEVEAIGRMFVMQLKKTIGILSLTFALTAHAQTAASATTGKPAEVPAAPAVLILHTSLTSKGSKVGQEVRATAQRLITLPDGQKLPKGTLFLGTVVAISKHSKDKPNGAVSLEFHQALPKGENPVPVLVKVVKLAPADTGDDTTTLPNSNGHMASLAANSGGSALLDSQLNDRSNLQGKFNNLSSIDGVYLSLSTQSSGIVFALGDDVYLDPDVQLSVLVAPITAAK
jgi:hypothetical protein